MTGTMFPLIFKRAAASRTSGEWRVLRTLAYGHHGKRKPTHGYEPTREDAMAAFAKSWRRE